MKRRKKSWRTFKKKESEHQKQICWRIRRACSIILCVEALILWKQAELPVVHVDRQENSWVRQAGESENSVLEQIFGVRLRVEKGVIEFYRREEMVDTYESTEAK